MDFLSHNLPANFKKTASVFLAQALASNVFPVPGGPYKRTPFGAWENEKKMKNEKWKNEK